MFLKISITYVTVNNWIAFFQSIFAQVAQLVEYALGKGEVSGPIPDLGLNGLR